MRKQTYILTNILCILCTHSYLTQANNKYLPAITVKLGSVISFSASDPPDPFGTTTFDGLRVNPTTVSPSFNAWYTHSWAVKPLAPKTAIVASKEVLLPLIAVVERGATKALVVPRMAAEANSRALNFMVVVGEDC